MTAYLIVYGKDPTDRFATYSFEAREGARSAERTLVPSVPVDGFGSLKPDGPIYPGVGGCSYVIEKDEDVPFNGPLMAAVYNALTGCSVKKFESRTIGLQRIMKALTERATPTQPPEETKVSDMNTETAAAAPTGKRGRKSQYDGSDRISLVVTGNPKRAGSAAHQRYEFYHDGMTIAEFEAAGGRSDDIRNDTAKGFITVTSAAS